MTEFAAALNKQHQDEMEALSDAASTERIEALKKRVAKLEAALADELHLLSAVSLWSAAMEAPSALPAAPAINPDPTA